MQANHPAWDNACLAVSLLAVDMFGLGGLALRARLGPVRDEFLRLLDNVMPNVRIHPAMEREALFGGMDLAATLQTGRIVHSIGLLARSPCVVLTMAERCSADRSAELSQHLDSNNRCLVLLDEGADAQEVPPAALMERVAFHLPLEGVRVSEATAKISPDIEAAQSRLKDVVISDDWFRAVPIGAARFGIDSMRAPYFAIKAAKAHAALNGQCEVKERDVAVGVELVLVPRAVVLPAEEDNTDSNEQPSSGSQGEESTEAQSLPEDIVVEAVRTSLPSDLLQKLQDGQPMRGAGGSGAGRTHKSNRRGRPLPSRPGRLGRGDRVDLIATLRSAAPWQSMRGREQAVRVLPGDIHVKRYEEKSDRLLIFAVDASGSAALARLGDAKGAVEILLSQAYASRDLVALIAFRGDRAEILLPPTRSLVQAKRRLTALPGGGGTPLATGLKAAAEMAGQARSLGMTPTLLLLTDGRANIALDGSRDRKQADDDTKAMANWIRGYGLPSIVFDTAKRPGKLTTLARDLNGQYLPLPRTDTAQFAKTINQVIGHGLAK